MNRIDELRAKFSYNIVDNEDKVKSKMIDESFFHNACIIEKYCKDGREKALSLTNLEQSYMWAIRSITGS